MTWAKPDYNRHLWAQWKQYALFFAIVNSERGHSRPVEQVATIFPVIFLCDRTVHRVGNYAATGNRSIQHLVTRKVWSRMSLSNARNEFPVIYSLINTIASNSDEESRLCIG